MSGEEKLAEQQRVRVEEVLHELLDLPEERHAEHARHRCADDDAVYREVLSLLKHCEDTDEDLLGAFAVNVTGPAPPVNRPLPAEVGQYTIKRLIRSGGMGDVYLAQQRHPYRTVALKIMKAGLVSRSTLRRFEHEAQLLARLHHSGIAQIYDAGMFDDGSGAAPYFAMEYVPGAKNIIDHAQAANLSTNDRLRLFARVCDAVHHGHQKGIIHRDLKPDNILVTRSGDPKVIDFGVARSTDSDLVTTTLQTQPGQIIGTVQYMSPEQCDADPDDLDTRSDVYSLGVVLYELLCARLPYSVSGCPLHEAIRRIKEEVPTRPGQLNRALRGDIETIVLKALDKDKERRYDSTAGFRDDIELYLNHEPITARSPGPIRALRNFARRYRATTAGIFGALLALLIAVITVVSLLVTYRARLFQVPDAILVAADDSKVSLLNLSGGILHEWDTFVEKGILFSMLIDPPLGDAPLILIGFSHLAKCEWAGSLCAFDGDHPESLLWTSQPGELPSRMPQPISLVKEINRFIFVDAIVADIFPEQPGLEIGVIHRMLGWSPTVVQVFGLDGSVLYEIWHDGHLSDLSWMAEAALVICAGNNNEGNWTHRGYENKDDVFAKMLSPVIIFAIKPQYQRLHQEWIRAGGGSGTIVPAWYRCLLPPEEAARVLMGAYRRLESNNLTRSPLDITFLLGSSPTRQWMSFTFDAEGNVISRNVHDLYWLEENLPDPGTFFFDELPPLVRSPIDERSTN